MNNSNSQSWQRIRSRKNEVHFEPPSISKKLALRWRIFHAEQKSHLSQNALMIEAFIAYMNANDARQPTEEELKQL